MRFHVSILRGFGVCTLCAIFAVLFVFVVV